MDINKKIEEIRKKPEHVRLRYVWGGMFLSMMIIVIVWVFSLRENFRSKGEEVPLAAPSFSELQDQLQQGPVPLQNPPSLEEFLGQKQNTRDQEYRTEAQPPSNAANPFPIPAPKENPPSQ